MPFATWGSRTAGSVNSSPGAPYLPFYAVLFYCKKPADWNSETYGVYGQDSFRPYFEITNPVAEFTYQDTVIPDVKGNPIIRCVANATDWKSNTGVCYVATSDMPATAATLLNLGGAHTPLTIPRSKVLNMHGAATGEVVSTVTTDTYYDQKGAHSGHFHRVDGVRDNIIGTAWGELPDTIDTTSAVNSDYQGITSIQITPILVDPKLALKDTRITTLPKGVMVFGDNLSTTYFSRSDLNDDSTSTGRDGKIAPLIAMRRVIETIGDSNLKFSVSSNNTPGHNHTSLPIAAKRLSNKTNQTAYVSLASAGEHAHDVNYQFQIALKSKILKAWITKADETPLANGMILAYSIGPTTGYDGIDNNLKTLPANWHFCDGSNGTPDLRGYYVYANLDSANTYHNVELNSSGSTITANSITVVAAGNHAHVSDEIGTASIRTSTINGTILTTGTPTDIGNHTFENRLDHTHAIATGATFKLNATDPGTVVNVKPGTTFSYSAPSVELAFIMFNENVI